MALIEFIPPKPETIRMFAQAVCELMADRTKNPIFIEHHVVRGLAKFVELAAVIQAKQMNDQQLIDRDAK